MHFHYVISLSWKTKRLTHAAQGVVRNPSGIARRGDKEDSRKCGDKARLSFILSCKHTPIIYCPNSDMGDTNKLLRSHGRLRGLTQSQPPTDLPKAINTCA